MNGDSRFLNGWKEIAVYLGRGVRTVQRWEGLNDLPVRRVADNSRSAVIAFVPDLDAWVQRKKTHQDENDVLLLETALRMVMERQS